MNALKIHRELIKRDFPYIQHKGKLTVLFENNTTSYFESRGVNMGFEYEILSEFCKDNNLQLDIRIASNQDNMMDMLNRGEVDLLACNLTVSNERKQIIDFSVPILNVEQVLVQRIADENSTTTFITDATQLAGKKVNVWKNSSHYTKLKSIQNEIGDSIFIYEENGTISTDYLIEQVADGTIDYTLADKNVAVINQYYWNNLDISLPLSFKQKISFGIRKNTPKFKAELDDWITKFKEKELYTYLNYKYFELPSTAKLALSSTVTTGTAQFIPALKAKTKNKPFDWQLVAAIIHQESRFNPNIIGLGGAYGLFQFMPNIGSHFNVYPNSSPEEQIEGGVELIRRNYNLWKETATEEDRIKFTLAAYNAGGSHVYDAIALARKHHLNPKVWDGNVAVMFKNLSNSEYYNDPVVKGGSARGAHTVNYVYEVYQKYLHYKNTK